MLWFLFFSLIMLLHRLLCVCVSHRENTQVNLSDCESIELNFSGSGSGSWSGYIQPVPLVPMLCSLPVNWDFFPLTLVPQLSCVSSLFLHLSIIIAQKNCCRVDTIRHSLCLCPWRCEHRCIVFLSDENVWKLFDGWKDPGVFVVTDRSLDASSLWTLKEQ